MKRMNDTNQRKQQILQTAEAKQVLLRTVNHLKNNAVGKKEGDTGKL